MPRRSMPKRHLKHRSAPRRLPGAMLWARIVLPSRLMRLVVFTRYALEGTSAVEVAGQTRTGISWHDRPIHSILSNRDGLKIQRRTCRLPTKTSFLYCSRYIHQARFLQLRTFRRLRVHHQQHHVGALGVEVEIHSAGKETRQSSRETVTPSDSPKPSASNRDPRQRTPTSGAMSPWDQVPASPTSHP